MKQKIHVFDMDGTLVDTFKQTQEAYHRAGVAFGPEHWGKSAEDWGCPKEAHKEKQRIYPDVLREMPPTLGFAASKWISTPSHSRVLMTGASHPTLRLTMRVFTDLGLHDASMIVYGASLKDKIAHLQVLAASSDVVYYEDQEYVADQIRKACPTILVITPSCEQ